MVRTSILAFSLSLVAIACQNPPAGTASDSDTSSGTTTDMAPTTGTSEPVPTTGSTSAPTTGTPATCEPGCGPEEACIAGTCEAVGRLEIEAGCHPIGDPAGRGQCVYPWPSDFYTEAAADSPTGLRVALPAELLPHNASEMPAAVDELIGGWPGWSANAQIRFASARTIDPAGLAPIDDIGGSLAAEASIVLVATSTGERWPYFAEVDATAGAGEPQTIFIRPMRRLLAGERYVVAVRGLREVGGEEIPPPPLFRALRDDLATDVPQLEAERGRYAEIFAALADAGVARASLQLAWDFTTTDDATVQRDFVAIAPQVEATAQGGDLGYTVEEVSENPDDEVPLIVRGRFTVPNCLEGTGATGSVFKRDPMGLPDCTGTTEAPFWLAVPKSVYDAKTPTRVAVYGHGLLGSGEEATSVVRKAGGIITLGTDFWGMSEEDIPTIVSLFSSNFAGARTLSDRLLQSAVNFTTLAYLAQGQLAADPAVQGLIDAEEVYYIGGSQGGIMGATVTAMAPNLRRAALVVGGSNYSLMVWRSTAFQQVNELWMASQPDTQDRELLFALLQSVFDLADPVTYAPQIAEAGDQLLLIASIGDMQVPNIASEAMARSYGMSMAGPPVYPVWDVEDAPADFTGSALLQVDTKMGPLPPKENLPGDGDNGAHGSAVDGPAVQGIVATFLLEGLVNNTCSGPCDPE